MHILFIWDEGESGVGSDRPGVFTPLGASKLTLQTLEWWGGLLLDGHGGGQDLKHLFFMLWEHDTEDLRSGWRGRTGEKGWEKTTARKSEIERGKDREREREIERERKREVLERERERGELKKQSKGEEDRRDRQLWISVWRVLIYTWNKWQDFGAWEALVGSKWNWHFQFALWHICLGLLPILPEQASASAKTHTHTHTQIDK